MTTRCNTYFQLGLCFILLPSVSEGMYWKEKNIPSRGRTLPTSDLNNRNGSNMLKDKEQKKLWEWRVWTNIALQDKQGLQFRQGKRPREAHAKRILWLSTLFQEANAKKLPSPRSYNHKKKLKEGFEPLFRLWYSLSRLELKELKK